MPNGGYDQVFGERAKPKHWTDFDENTPYQCYICTKETLGEVLVIMTQAQNATLAHDLCCDALRDCSGRWMTFEISEEQYQQNTHHPHRHTKHHTIYSGRDIIAEGDVYVLMSGHLSLDLTFKEGQDA